ncbi:MAG: hypothetical protein CSB24_06090 [Deltaproteobacteria bacterium]|nr:MAG: hypothetical protein CSB24_06090 [Deltaproteobacteria bacterium]
MITRLIILLLGLAAGLAAAGGAMADDVSLQQANAAYNGKDYQKAASLYQQLIDSRGYSAELLFNLANSYACQGMTGKAMVNYYRAGRLAPNDPDIKRNLVLLAKESGLFTEEKSLANSLVDRFTFNQWCIFALAGLTVFSMVYGSTCLVRIKKGVLIFSLVPALIAMLLAGAAAWVSFGSYHDAVIIGQENILRISPFATAGSAGSLPPGKRVKVLKKHHDFRLVQDKTGQSGWLEAANLEPINI